MGPMLGLTKQHARSDGSSERDEMSFTSSTSSSALSSPQIRQRQHGQRLGQSRSLHAGSAVLNMLRSIGSGSSWSAAVAPDAPGAPDPKVTNHRTVHGASNFAALAGKQHQLNAGHVQQESLLPGEAPSIRSAPSRGGLLWPFNGVSSPAARKRRTPAKSVHGGSAFFGSAPASSMWPTNVFAHASPFPRRRGTASSLHGGSLYPHKEIPDGKTKVASPEIVPHATFVIDPRTFAIHLFEPSDDSERLLQMGRVLDEICSRNVLALERRHTRPTIFDAPDRLPEIAIGDYLIRIRRYSKFSFVCFGVALNYIGRLVGAHRQMDGENQTGEEEHVASDAPFAEYDATSIDDVEPSEHAQPNDCPHCLTSANVHRLLLASISLACKASDDVIHKGSFMALCGYAGSESVKNRDAWLPPVRYLSTQAIPLEQTTSYS